jgi:hypothetical protein
VDDGRCKNLWICVILQAIVDYVYNRGATGRSSRRIFYSAEWWLFEDESGRTNSFLTLCSILDMPPEQIREAAKRLTKEELRQLKLEGSRRRNVQAPRYNHPVQRVKASDPKTGLVPEVDHRDEEAAHPVLESAGSVADWPAAGAQRLFSSLDPAKEPNPAGPGHSCS